jgi:hypothetical protein
MMSNMLRGLPMQATTTQSYQAQPSTLNQGLGVLAGAAGARQAGLFAEGGTIKGLAAGGVAGYANRGMVQANPDSSVVRGIRSKLEMMGVEELQRVAQTSPSEEIRAMAIQILQEQKIREQAEAQAQQSIAQDQRGLPTPVTERAGLPAAPAGSMDMLSAASGGIVAFAGPDGSQVDLDEDETTRLQKDFANREAVAKFLAQRRKDAGIGAPKASLADLYAKQQADLAEDRKRKGGYDLLNFGIELGTQPGGLLQAGLQAGKRALPGMIAREDALRGRESDIAKGRAEVAEADRLMQLGDFAGADAIIKDREDRRSREKVASTKTPGEMTSYAQAMTEKAVLSGDTRNPKIIFAEFAQKYIEGKTLPGFIGAGARALTADTGVESAAAKEIKDVKNRYSIQLGQYDPNSKEYKDLEQKRDKEIEAVRLRYTKTPPSNLMPAEVNNKPLPMPASAKDAVAGKTYNTAQGPAVWDGTKFVAVAR